ncbi:MAG: hypothetical protein COW65_04430, partial [Cytophagales bacterium CG18_big_fil_WC_8_21_14_2_50_42_9]
LFLAVFYYLAALAVRTVYLDENLAHSISLNPSLPLFYPFILFLPQPKIHIIIMVMKSTL